MVKKGDTVKEFGVLLLGNGLSRLKHKRFIRKWLGELWVCNSDSLKDHRFANRCGSVHYGEVKKILNFVENQETDTIIYTTKEVIDKLLGKRKDRVTPFTQSGWATGSLMLYQALIEGYCVTITGFDFGGEDVYTPGTIFGGNLIKQYREIEAKFGKNSIRVR